jgi:hypothetical protein
MMTAFIATSWYTPFLPAHLVSCITGYLVCQQVKVGLPDYNSSSVEEAVSDFKVLRNVSAFVQWF